MRGGAGVTKVARFLLALSLVLVVCGPVHAEKAAAYVAARQGEVYAIGGDGVVRDLKVRDKVAVNDYIVTENKGRVRIVFEDNTVIALGENSRIKISDYRWSRDKRQGRFEVTVSEGIFRILGGMITKSNPEAFVAKTPAANIGIRGSGYAGRVSGQRLEVFLLHGKGVDVTNRGGSAALLFPGMGTTVASPGSPPTAPRLFTTMERQEIEVGSEVGGATGSATPGSVINGVIVNQAEISSSVNAAIGKNNTAAMGSVRVSGSTVDGTVVNRSTTSNAANIAAGSDNTALSGSVEAE